MNTKILGISASYRGKSGTTEAIRKALEGAESIDPNVETKLITLRGKKISACVHCDGCYRKQSGCVINDDFQEIYEEFLEADGYIIGSPVYEMTFTPILSAFFSRIRCTYVLHPGHYTTKVGAALSVGGHRHGGQEMTLMGIQNFYNTNDIITCGGTFKYPGGSCLWSGDGSHKGALNDTVGLDSAYQVGRRLAQTTALMKFGEERYKEEGFHLSKITGWYDGCEHS